MAKKYEIGVDMGEQGFNELGNLWTAIKLIRKYGFKYKVTIQKNQY